jgi:UTP--glucose-1-phosphate uridylyltransferase
MEITKALIPVAGLGTRFYPVTKSIPKEMLPLLNKPALHYILEEGLQSAIKQFVIVTNKYKYAIENYLDSSPELEILLGHTKKQLLTSDIEKIINAAQFVYLKQPEPLGLGHAVWLARNIIGKEYFGIFLPDDIITGKEAGLAQLIRVARQEKASVIAVQEIPMECASSYGMVAIKKQITSNLFQVASLVEKPQPKDAPSNLAIIGRYVLSHKIFKALDETSVGAGQELQLTDAISCMMMQNEKVLAYKIQGTRYDIGTPLGWIKAIITMALQHPEYAPQIRSFLTNLDSLDFMYNHTKNISHTP